MPVFKLNGETYGGNIEAQPDIVLDGAVSGESAFDEETGKLKIETESNLTADDIFAFPGTIIIPDNSDLNDYRSPGVYSIISGTTVLNAAWDSSNNSSAVIVINTGRHTRQISFLAGNNFVFASRYSVFNTEHWTNWDGKVEEAKVADELTTFQSTNDKLVNRSKNAIGATKWMDDEDQVFDFETTAVYMQFMSDLWQHMIQADWRTGQIALRAKNNGVFQDWRKVVDHLNFRNLIPNATVSASGLMSSSDKKNSNSLYVRSFIVQATNTFSIQTKFSSFGTAGDRRQSIFLFGSANGNLIYGLINISSSSSTDGTWSGIGTVTIKKTNNGQIIITLPTTAYDAFTVMSGEPIEVV